MYKIGIIGLGTVGFGVVEILQKMPQYGIDFEIKTVCSRSIKDCSISWTNNYNDIINDSEIDIVIELIGGNTDSHKIIHQSLLNKKHVVTANKMLLAERGTELIKLAKQNNVKLLFEAAVCGGIPIINTLKNIAQFDKITKIEGILSGSCTYILSTMQNEGREFSEVLKTAQKLGYVESDPTLDISGLDAAHKACILYEIAFKKPFLLKDINLTGIENILLKDIKICNQNGTNLRLVAEITENSIILKPIALEKSSKLYHISQSLNGILIYSKYLNSTYLEGCGAGRYPTAGSVITNVCEIIG